MYLIYVDHAILIFIRLTRHETTKQIPIMLHKMEVK